MYRKEWEGVVREANAHAGLSAAELVMMRAEETRPLVEKYSLFRRFAIVAEFKLGLQLCTCLNQRYNKEDKSLDKKLHV